MTPKEGVPEHKGSAKTPAPKPEPETPDLALPEPVEAVLKEVPPPQREKVRETFAALLQFQGPMPNPLLGKLTSEHLDKLIDGADKDNQRMYADRKEGRGQSKFLSVCGIVGFVVLCGLFLWAKQTQLLDKVIQVAVIFAGGLGAGLGLARRRPN